MKQLRSFKVLLQDEERTAKSFAHALSIVDTEIDPEFKGSLEPKKLPNDRWEFHWDGYPVAVIWPCYP